MTEISIPGIDVAALQSWMDSHGLSSGPIENVELLEGGTQNILARFGRNGQVFVLRRPPLHKRKNSDETMRREARVLAAIADSDVPHPRLIAAEPDTELMGASFYLMSSVDGFNITTGLPEFHANDPDAMHRMGLAMVEAIVALGAVDFAAAGLGDFGKPDGWLERQVPRWRAHLDSYSEVPEYPGPDIPHLDEVSQWLDEARPATWLPGIIHGDFHLSNVMFRHDSGDLAAVVDWELSTIGDPMMDLGWLLATWQDPDLPSSLSSSGPPETRLGLASIDELVAHYGELSGRDVSHARWYGAMACYKLGIILEGTHVRAMAGKASKETGDTLHASTVGLFERAKAFIDSSS